MKPTRTRSKVDKSRLQLLHQYYIYTGFYSFILKALRKAIPIVIVLIAAIVVINQFIDINASLVYFTQILPIYGVLGFFFISETILGLVPPEMFIAWAGKLKSPWLFLCVLSILSYFGGLLAYGLGHLFTKNRSFHRYLEVKMKKQLENSKKWGGFLIIIGALLPVPFAVSCMTAGIIKFPFKKVILYGSLRMVRIFGYGMVVYHLL
ncbi:short-chain dehydrogenase [Lacinutrix sp. WUR7]|uniref:YqaA family protein n=1 Tax=Lacinutrix sp. WUR7 TaxID=2653681 RepID=UPI00193D8EEC|nr:VTT domain-containing protein [Lacinutrix sp. WUR7]QRM90342.1 short-chain dehydrogenase [Lacinutrix sp. WUR7]